MTLHRVAACPQFGLVRTISSLLISAVAAVALHSAAGAEVVVKQFDSIDDVDQPLLFALSADGRSLAAVLSNGTVDIWDAATGKRQRSIDKALTAGSYFDASKGEPFLFSNKGGALHLLLSHELKTLDLGTGQTKSRRVPLSRFIGVHANTDGSLSVAASRAQGTDGEIVAFATLGGGRPDPSLPEVSRRAHWWLGAYSGDGRVFAAAHPLDRINSDSSIQPDTAKDPDVAVVYRDGQNPVKVKAKVKIVSLSLSQDGSRLALGTVGGVEIWDTANNVALAVFESGGRGWVTPIAISPAGDRVAYQVETNSGGASEHRLEVRATDQSSGPLSLPTKMPSDFSSEVKWLAFSPDGASVHAAMSFIPNNSYKGGKSNSGYAKAITAYRLNDGDLVAAAAAERQRQAAAAEKKAIEEAQSRARTAERNAQIQQRDKAVKALDCEELRSLDKALGGDTLTICLDNKRTAAMQQLDCEQVAAIDKEIGGTSASDCRVAKAIKGGSAREIYLLAVKLDSEKDRVRARKLYAALLERFPNDDLALKAGERLATMTDVEAIEASNAAAQRAAEQAKAAAEAEGRANRAALDQAAREAADRQVRERNQSCSGRGDCYDSCVYLPDPDSRGHCRSQCASRFAGC